MPKLTHLRRLFVLICLATTISFLLFYRRIGYHPSLPASSPSYAENTNVSETYIVATKTCRIPLVKPFDEEVMRFYRRPKPINCKSAFVEAPLIRRIYNRKLAEYSLEIKTELVPLYVKESDDRVICCYSKILRPSHTNGPEADVEFSMCHDFQEIFRVPRHLFAVYVECRSWRHNDLVYSNAFYFIQKPIRRNMTHSTDVRASYGVLLLGIEKLSQINMRRSMPKTFASLESFHEVPGYSKIARSAFFNLMAVLTGHTPQRVHQLCNASEPGALDSCPFLWHMANQLQLPTAYAEDVASMQTFNRHKVGFQQPPTDYYLRPFMQAIETRLPVQRTPESPLPYCIGEKQAAEYVLDFALEFAQRFKSRGGFGVFWLKSFSLPHYALPARMDAHVANWLQRLRLEGLYDRYVLVLLSDSGAADQQINDVPSGYLEERLPALFIRLPEIFKRLYGLRASQLPQNSGRLVSPYDLHLTLQQLLVLARGDFLRLPESPQTGCPTAFSLLETVPPHRRCHDAGIAEYWCSCQPWENLPRSSLTAKRLAVQLVNYMKEELRELQLDASCELLQLQTILHICRLALTNADGPKNQSYMLRFTAKPGKAVFHAAFVYDEDKRSIRVGHGDIRRLDRGWQQSVACASNGTWTQLLCVCRQSSSAAAATKVGCYLTLMLTSLHSCVDIAKR